jgi:hypothetical protein
MKNTEGSTEASDSRLKSLNHTSPQMNQHCMVDNKQFHAMAALTPERSLRYTTDEAEQVGEELSSKNSH